MKLKFLTVFALGALMISCGGEKAKEEVANSVKEEVKTEVKAEAIKIDPMTDKGVGPIKTLTLADIDENLVAKGQEVYKVKCTACHKISKRFVGPGLKGITERRTPEWIMNMILNPEVMVVENETAKQLLIEYSAPMANQSLTEEEARAILEYLRTKN
ncbi:MAG: cytochrome c [Flavobacteriaceae bacterium]|nr:cytochrome c [Flavobacteriaceae bacterium]